MIPRTGGGTISFVSALKLDANDNEIGYDMVKTCLIREFQVSAYSFLILSYLEFNKTNYFAKKSDLLNITNSDTFFLSIFFKNSKSRSLASDHWWSVCEMRHFQQAKCKRYIGYHWLNMTDWGTPYASRGHFAVMWPSECLLCFLNKNIFLNLLF